MQQADNQTSRQHLVTHLLGCSFLTPLSLVASIQCFRNANVSTIDLCFQLLLQANNIPATTEVDVPASNSDQNQEIQPVSEIAAVCNARDSLDCFSHPPNLLQATPETEAVSDPATPSPVASPSNAPQPTTPTPTPTPTTTTPTPAAAAAATTLPPPQVQHFTKAPLCPSTSHGHL